MTKQNPREQVTRNIQKWPRWLFSNKTGIKIAAVEETKFRNLLLVLTINLLDLKITKEANLISSY
jgi:hypothetical protein